ncbi:MAG: tRNA (guanosine(37)-N1)-methyltransferase TrmD [Christensenella sp.]|nr:tRNA (guanosine(37)-N1)-methyltransferase TrmD [Christensenella sp.]
MRIDILTLFPEMFDGVFSASMLGRAQANGLIDIRVHNIRDYTDNKHKKADDYPFGGGAGLVMMAQPIYDCMDAVLEGGTARRILMTPRGRTLNQKIAKELSGEERLVLLCGHYEGVDERVMEIIDDEISVGDYVLTGGELPAMIVVDCVSRLIPGVLGSDDSAADESFSEDLLEYPQYTRPASFRGMDVPEILLNGHHAKIQAWRQEQARLKTALNRPDLLKETTEKGETIEAPDDAWL